MKNFYFKIIIIVCLVFIILLSNTKVFASSSVASNVNIQQDVSAHAIRDIETVRSIIANNNSFRESLLASPSTDLCYAIKPASGNDSNINLFVYRKTFITGVTSDDNYYGIVTPGFFINEYILYSISRGSFVRSYTSNVNIWLPSFFYLRSIVELTDGLDTNSSIVSSVEDNTNAVNVNTNAVKENTEVSKDTENFLKDDSQVADSEITGMTNSFDDLDNIQDTGSDDIGNVFDLFSDNRNTEGQSFSFSLSVPFTNENLNITIDKNLTRNTLLSLCGGSTFVQGLVILCIQFLWSFFIFKFIVINLISLIDKIRTGDITNIRTRNVLVDVL